MGFNEKVKQNSGKEKLSALTLTPINSLNGENDYETINKNVKIIIVGTLTPKTGRYRGYFYSSNKDMYKLLDMYVETDLQNLIKKKDKKQRVKEVQKDLYQHKIAFMDVVDQAIVYPINSTSDNDIVDFTLDYKNFYKVLCNKNIKGKIFICDSKAALMAFEMIIKKFINSDKNINKIKIEDISYRYIKLFRGCKYADWMEILNKHLKD